MPEEFPHGHVNPLVGMALAEHNTVQESLITDEIRPTQAQYAMGPGAMAILPGTSSTTDQSVTVVRLLNPEEHAEEFPDWEDRLMNSYVLTWLCDQEDPDGYTAWISRVKLIELDQEQYDIVHGYLTTDFPDTVPDWLDQKFSAYQIALSEMAPDSMPAPIACGTCGKYNVVLHFIHVTDFTMDVGVVGSEQKFAALEQDISKSCRSSARLVCTACRATAEVGVDVLKAAENGVLHRAVMHEHGD